MKHMLECCLTSLIVIAALSGVALADVVVVGEAVQTQQATPGAAIEGTIAVRNTGLAPTGINVYQTDYLFQADGSNTFGEPGSNPRSNAPWLRVDTTSQVIPAGATINVTYHGQVPTDAGLSGTYWSVIMIEEDPTAPTRGETGRDEPAVGVRTIQRHGVQVVTELENGAAPDLVFENPVLGTDPNTGVPTLRVDARNIGTELIRPETTVEILDENGERVAEFEGRLKRVYPGTSVRHEFLLDGLEPGTYQAVVIADGGSEHVFGVRYTLNVAPQE